jgi:hypothetical protein
MIFEFPVKSFKTGPLDPAKMSKLELVKSTENLEN